MSYDLKDNPLRCGCIIYTVNAMVKDVDWCEEHQALWDAALQEAVDRHDQWIEDQIFNGGFNN